MLSFVLIILVSVNIASGFVDLECVNPDGTLAPSATNCYNLYGDYPCSLLFPDNDSANPMAVGKKNERPRKCFTNEKENVTVFTEEDFTRLDALVMCPQRCGYCCVDDTMETYFAKAFDCVNVPSEFCKDVIIGNLVKKYCPQKCGLTPNQPKIGH